MTTGNKGNFFRNNKKELIGTGIGAAGGALIGGLASRASARRRADELGLEGSERRRFIAGKTAAGAGIGTVAGGAAGFGASKIPFKGSDKKSSTNHSVVVPTQFANSKAGKNAVMTFEQYKKEHPGATEGQYRHFIKRNALEVEGMRLQQILANHNDPNHGTKLTQDQQIELDMMIKKNKAHLAKFQKGADRRAAKESAIRVDIANAKSPEDKRRLEAELGKVIADNNAFSNNIYDNLNTLKMATIIFDEELRSFSVIEDHMYGEVKDHLKKYKTYYMGGGTAVAGGTAAGIIAKKKARKEADRRGLTGAARKRFIAGRVAGAAAAGTVGGAALGAGASIGLDYAKAMKDADIQSKYGKTAEEWKKLTASERALLKKQAGWDKELTKRSEQQRIKDAKESRNKELANAKTKEQKLRIKQNYQKAVLAAKKDTQSKALERKEAIRKGREGVSLWGITKKAFNPNNQ